jgi:hypothetical protein
MTQRSRQAIYQTGPGALVCSALALLVSVHLFGGAVQLSTQDKEDIKGKCTLTKPDT